MASDFDPKSLGSETRPAAASAWVPGTALGTQGFPLAPLSLAAVPELYGLVYGDGLQRLRNVVKGETVPNGIIPPKGFVAQTDPPSAPWEAFSWGTQQPVIVWEWDRSAISSLTNTNFIVTRGEHGNYPFCTLEGVDGTPSPGGVTWQFRRVYDDIERTMDAIVAAINDDSTNTDWAAPGAASLASFYEGVGDLTAVRVGYRIYVTWAGHPKMGSLVFKNDTSSADLTCFVVRSTVTVEEKAHVDGYTLYYPDPEGQVTVGSKAPGAAWTELWLPTIATNGVIDVTRDSGGTTFYFRMKFVTAFTTADAYWQIIKAAQDYDTLRAVQDALEGKANANVQAPGSAASSYLGSADFRFRQVGTNGGYFYRRKAGESGDDAYIYQTAATTGGAPAYQTRTQFANGDDGWESDAPAEGPDTGDYRYALGWYRELDKAVSGIGEPYKVAVTGGMVRVSRFPAPEDDSVDYHRIWRTLLDGLGDYYRVDEHPYQSGSPGNAYDDEKSDLQIAGLPGSVYYNQRHFRTRAAGYPPHHRFLARHLGALWGGGLSRSATWTGTCNVTNGSDQVHVDGPVVPTRLWIGRSHRVDASTRRYVIVDVAEDTADLTLGEEYEGETASGVAFTVEDDRVAYSVNQAVTGKPNQWPARPLEGVDGEHRDGITGFLPKQRDCYVWTRGGTWVVSGSGGGGFAVEPVSDSVGLVTQRCLVTHDRVAYWLQGPAGFYRWDFVGPPQRISNPPFTDPGDPRGIQGTVDRINWSAIEWAHGVCDPDGRLVRWFVPVDGSEHPNYVITLDLKSMTWGEDDCPPVTASASVILGDGSWAVLAGDAEGRVWMLDVGDSDGCHGLEPVQRVSTATKKSVTVKNTITDAVDGCSVLVVSQAAAGSQTPPTYQLAHVSRQDGSTFHFREELDSVPSEDDFVVLGAILYRMRPNRFDAGVKDEEKLVPVMWLHSRKESDGDLYVTVYDQDGDAYVGPLHDSPLLDLSAGEDASRVRVNMRGHELGFDVLGYVPNYRPALRRFELHMVVRSKAQTGT